MFSDGSRSVFLALGNTLTVSDLNYLIYQALNFVAYTLISLGLTRLSLVMLICALATFLSLGVLRQLEATPTSCLNASVQALSGPHFLLNGLLTFGTVYQATLLIFLHSPHSSVQLNVLISVTFLILRNFSLHTGAIFMFICSQHCLQVFFVCVFV